MHPKPRKLKAPVKSDESVYVCVCETESTKIDTHSLAWEIFLHQRISFIGVFKRGVMRTHIKFHHHFLQGHYGEKMQIIDATMVHYFEGN